MGRDATLARILLAHYRSHASTPPPVHVTDAPSQFGTGSVRARLWWNGVRWLPIMSAARLASVDDLLAPLFALGISPCQVVGEGREREGKMKPASAKGKGAASSSGWPPPSARRLPAPDGRRLLQHVHGRPGRRHSPVHGGARGPAPVPRVQVVGSRCGSACANARRTRPTASRRAWSSREITRVRTQCCRGRRCWSCIGPERRGFRVGCAHTWRRRRRLPWPLLGGRLTTIPPKFLSTPYPQTTPPFLLCNGHGLLEFRRPLLDYAPYSPYSFSPTPHQMQTAGVCEKVIEVVVVGAMLYLLMTPTAPRMPMPHAMMGAATALRSTLQDSFAAPKGEVFQSISSEPEADETVPRPVREMPIYHQAPRWRVLVPTE